jgi:hypothetical protein
MKAFEVFATYVTPFLIIAPSICPMSAISRLYLFSKIADRLL